MGCDGLEGWFWPWLHRIDDQYFVVLFHNHSIDAAVSPCIFGCGFVVVRVRKAAAVD